MVGQLRTPQDWTLERAVITQDGIQGYLDITKIITDIEIHEHLDKAYLTGSVALIDSNNVFNVSSFGGAEVLEISIRLPLDDATSFTRKFIIDSVTANTKTNDSTAALVLHLIDYHAYVSHTTNVNAAYTGTSSTIIEKILSDNIGMAIDKPFLSEAQQPMRVVIPNWTALNAARWVRNRAATIDGTPYYLFATLFNENIQYKSLAELLTENPTNPNAAYWYSQANAQTSVAGSIEQQSYNIQSYQDRSDSTLLQLVDQGFVGATHFFVDPSVGLPIKADMNIDLAFQQLVKAGILKQGQRDYIYKNNYLVKEKPLHEQPGRVHTHITMRNLYNDGFMGHNEAFDLQTYRLFVIREAFKRFLTSESIDIVIPGFNFLREETAIGKNINVKFLSTKMNNSTQSEIDLLDKKRSGEHMIYATRHMFKIDGGYNTVASCVKMADLEILSEVN